MPPEVCVEVVHAALLGRLGQALVAGEVDHEHTLVKLPDLAAASEGDEPGVHHENPGQHSWGGIRSVAGGVRRSALLGLGVLAAAAAA